MKHIVITGGSGFIGSHLCDLLLQKGYAVTAVDNLVTGREKNISEAKTYPHFDFLNADISRPIEWSALKFIKLYGVHGVFHFACPASPIDFEKIPFEILEVDSVGTFNTVDLALKYDARYILASTSEIYGDPLVHPQSEDYWGNVNTIGPRACYDETKRFAEAVVSTAMRGVGVWGGKSYKPLNAAMVRIFNTYGPRMRPDDGRIVPELCMQALKGEPLTVHGSGEQTRSFCYVTDLVDGIVKLFESSVKEPVNIGNPIERSVLDFAESLKRVLSSKLPIKHLEARPDDPRKRCPNISRAQSLLNWSPKVDLEDGLRRTIEYFKNYS